VAGKNKSSKDRTVGDDADAKPDDDLSTVSQSSEAETKQSDDIEENLSDSTSEPWDDDESTVDADAAVSELEDTTSEGAAETADVHGPAEEAPDSPDTSSHAQAQKEIVVRKGGFFPMLLGGIAAGAIGIGAAQYLPEGFLPFGNVSEDEDRVQLQKALDAQIAKIANLNDKIEAASQEPDLSGIETAQESLAASVSDMSSQLETLETQLSNLDARLTDVEQRPVTEGASDAAVAAYERELRALQDAMATQRAEIENMTAEAREMEESAEATAQATMRRAALTRIQTALDAGAGFAPALADLEAAGADVPEALQAVAEDGVTSMTELQEQFPDAARRALAVSRAATADDGEKGGFSDFLFAQLGARSLEPKEGNSPDAVLSRAEAALREGRLTDALAELQGLPEQGRAELSDWAGAAAERLDAIAAAQALGENLN